MPLGVLSIKSKSGSRFINSGPPDPLQGWGMGTGTKSCRVEPPKQQANKSLCPESWPENANPTTRYSTTPPIAACNKKQQGLEAGEGLGNTNTNTKHRVYRVSWPARMFASVVFCCEKKIKKKKVCSSLGTATVFATNRIFNILTALILIITVKSCNPIGLPTINENGFPSFSQ